MRDIIKEIVNIDAVQKDLDLIISELKSLENSDLTPTEFELLKNDINRRINESFNKNKTT